MPYNTDAQLKLTLARMLPHTLYIDAVGEICWYYVPDAHLDAKVLPSELLHLCWLVELGLTPLKQAIYARYLHPRCKGMPLLDDYCVAHSTWQQRVTALAKTLNI